MANPALLALAFNLLPVLLAVFLGWNLLSLMLVYWAENVIVGAINVVKMTLSGVTKGIGETISTVFYVPFFIVHYGLFCAVHGVLILVLFSGEPDESVEDPTRLPYFFFRRVDDDGFLALSLFLLATLHLYWFVYDWLLVREWRRTTPIVQMFMPYGRIVVVHVAVLFGGFAASLIGSPVIAVLLLAFLKTALEVGATQIATAEPKPA